MIEPGKRSKARISEVLDLWWVQAEALVALLEVHQHKPPRSLDGSFAGTLEWILRRQADWRHGEWHRGQPGSRAGRGRVPITTGGRCCVASPRSKSRGETEALYVAQSILQLYRQLEKAGYRDEDLALVRSTYELAMEVFSGLYQPSQKPFVTHGVGTASVLATYGQPTPVIAAGLIHNIYGNGDFGDGTRGRKEKKAKEIRRRIGEEVERYVSCFARLNLSEESLAGIVERFDCLDKTERKTVLIWLADQVEHLLDAAIAYSPNRDNRHAMTGRMLGHMMELARRSGHPPLADELRGMHRASADAVVPSSLRRNSNWHFAFRVPPRSYRARILPRIRERLWRGFGLRQAARRSLARLRQA